jgi:hypothetical protein
MFHSFRYILFSLIPPYPQCLLRILPIPTHYLRGLLSQVLTDSSLPGISRRYNSFYFTILLLHVTIMLFFYFCYFCPFTIFATIFRHHFSPPFFATIFHHHFSPPFFATIFHLLFNFNFNFTICRSSKAYWINITSWHMKML